MTRLRHALDLAARTGFWRDVELWAVAGIATTVLALLAMEAARTVAAWWVGR